MKRKIIAVFTAILTVLSLTPSVFAEFEVDDGVKSAVLIEPYTKTVIYSKNADEKLPPASVTKIMTALLVMEAIDGGSLSYDDEITVSANASGMGGSQIFLEVGEKIKVEELLKGMMVASGNDAAMAFAEAIGGSEKNFVDMMNKKAEELSMSNTHFMNCHGLDEDNHYTTAADIATMSAELICKHPDILKYSSIWTDTIRDGKTSLANTNKLVRFYNGCDGLKTGSTSIAKCCISATAEKDNMRLISVVMAAPDTNTRFQTARQMFDYGFAVKSFASISESDGEEIKVSGGKKATVCTKCLGASMLIDKSMQSGIVYETEITDELIAPVEYMQVVGKVKAMYNGSELFSCDIVADEEIDRLSFGDIFSKLLSGIYGRR